MVSGQLFRPMGGHFRAQAHVWAGMWGEILVPEHPFGLLKIFYKSPRDLSMVPGHSFGHVGGYFGALGGHFGAKH